MCPYCRKPFTKEQVKRVVFKPEKVEHPDGHFEEDIKIGGDKGLVVLAPDVQSEVNMAFGSHVGLPEAGDEIEMPRIPTLEAEEPNPDAPPADNEVA